MLNPIYLNYKSCKAKKDLESKLLQADYGSAGYKSISNELQKNQKAIDKYSESLSEKTTTIQDQYDTLFSAYQDGSLSSSQIKTMREAYQVLSDIGSVNMTGTGKSLNALNTFFSSSMGHSGIQDYLTRVAASGGDVNKALKNLGLSLSDLGLKNNASGAEALSRYFKDLAKSAEEASGSIQKVDGSFSGIATAFESQNGGDNLDSFLDFLSQANQLKKAGKTGTDEFFVRCSLSCMMIYVVKHHDREENAEYHLVQSAHKWFIYNTGHAYQISKRDIAKKRNDGIDGNKNIIHAASF